MTRTMAELLAAAMLEKSFRLVVDAHVAAWQRAGAGIVEIDAMLGELEPLLEDCREREMPGLVAQIERGGEVIH